MKRVDAVFAGGLVVCATLALAEPAPVPDAELLEFLADWGEADAWLDGQLGLDVPGGRGEAAIAADGKRDGQEQEEGDEVR